MNNVYGMYTTMAAASSGPVVYVCHVINRNHLTLCTHVRAHKTR